MSKKPVFIITGTLLLSLVGCGGSDFGPDSGVEAAAGELRVIFAADPEGDSVNIIDSTELAVSIDRHFGDEDAEAIDIIPGDSIGDVLARAGNG